MMTEADAPCAARMSVSGPSVSPSATIGTWIVATPLALSVATPISEPPVMSAELTPAIA